MTSLLLLHRRRELIQTFRVGCEGLSNIHCDNDIRVVELIISQLECKEGLRCIAQ